MVDELDQADSNTATPHAPARVPLRARFVGALLGGAIGDALGRPVEGHSLEYLRAHYPNGLADYQKWPGWTNGPIGTITDDTQLTMCVAECLTTNGNLNPADLARRFVDWLPIGRGKGRATVAAVTRLQNGIPWQRAGEDSAGNGAAMRSAPIGLLRWDDPLLSRAESILSALPTHRTPMAVAGAVAVAAATAFLAARTSNHWTVEEFIVSVQRSIVGIEPNPLSERRDPSVHSTLHDRIGMLPALLEDGPDTVFARLYNGAYTLESVPAALYCFLRSPKDVEQMLLLAVSRAYDADTVAAIAGTLGGALGGLGALPKRFLGELEYRDELTALGNQLHALAAHGDSTQVPNWTYRFALTSMISNAKLTERDIPEPDAKVWTILTDLGLTFDGYRHWGSFNKCSSISKKWTEQFADKGFVPTSLTELRTCLFFEHRRWRDAGPAVPDEREIAYIHALVEAIRGAVRAGQRY